MAEMPNIKVKVEVVSYTTGVDVTTKSIRERLICVLGLLFVVFEVLIWGKSYHRRKDIFKNEQKTILQNNPECPGKTYKRGAS